MPNAIDLTRDTLHKFLVVGTVGSGKTAAFLTLPGRKFIYAFEPNVLPTIQGFNVDYEAFFPQDVSLKLTSLSKETRKNIPRGRQPAEKAGADLYWQWEEHFEKACDSGFFDGYDIIGFDSCTTLLSMIMDGILALNGRAGQWPNVDDYGPQMMAFTNIVRKAASLQKTIFFTGHIDMRQDEVTKRITNQMMLTGQLKTKIPILFSEVLVTEAETDSKGNSRFLVQTKPDRFNPSVRCSLREVNPKENITIDWNKDPELQGLGGLYFNDSNRGESTGGN